MTIVRGLKVLRTATALVVACGFTVMATRAAHAGPDSRTYSSDARGTALTQTLRVVDHPGDSLVFWANYFFLGTSADGYIGYASSGVVNFSIWGATDCRLPPGAVGGPCTTDLDGEPNSGRRFSLVRSFTNMKFAVALVERTPTGTWWRGTVTDTDANRESILGEVFVPGGQNSLLQPNQQFMEYTGGGYDAPCVAFGSSTVVWGMEYVDGKAYAAHDVTSVCTGHGHMRYDGSVEMAGNRGGSAAGAIWPAADPKIRLEVESGGSSDAGPAYRVGLGSGGSGEMFVFATDNTIRTDLRCLTANQSDGSVPQADCVGSSPHQQWLHLSDGQIYNVGRAECLTSDAAIGIYPIHTKPCRAGANQKWIVPERAPDRYMLTNRSSGQALDYDRSADTSVQQPVAGYMGQMWTLSTDPWGGLVILNRASRKALDVPGGSTTPGEKTIQWPVTGGANQSWTPTAEATGDVVLTNAASGQVLDVEGNSRAIGARVVQWPAKGTDNQRWHFQAYNDR
jgi:hypothetical protein